MLKTHEFIINRHFSMMVPQPSAFSFGKIFCPNCTNCTPQPISTPIEQKCVHFVEKLLKPLPLLKKFAQTNVNFLCNRCNLVFKKNSDTWHICGRDN